MVYKRAAAVAVRAVVNVSLQFTVGRAIVFCRRVGKVQSQAGSTDHDMATARSSPRTSLLLDLQVAACYELVRTVDRRLFMQFAAAAPLLGSPGR